jgi:hypothetical protein
VQQEREALFLFPPFRVALKTAGLCSPLPGNASVNTVQRALIEKAVFSVSSVPGSSGNSGVMQPIIKQRLCKHARYATINEALFSVMRCPILDYINKAATISACSIDL